MSGGARNRSLGFVTRITTLPPAARTRVKIVDRVNGSMLGFQSLKRTSWTSVPTPVTMDVCAGRVVLGRTVRAVQETAPCRRRAAPAAAAVRGPAAAQPAGRPRAAKTASRHHLAGETDRLAGGLLCVEEGVDARSLQDPPPFCFVGPRQPDGDRNARRATGEGPRD